jgi:hypothetical protein
MAGGEETARALSEIDRLHEVVDDLRSLLAAAVAADRRAEEATPAEENPSPS